MSWFDTFSSKHCSPGSSGRFRHAQHVRPHRGSTSESEGDCVWRGSRRSVGSSFHRQGATYWKERLVTFKENRVGRRARVTVYEERVLRQGWKEIKLWRYWGWFVVRTLYVRERSLYLMLSFILSQCRYFFTNRVVDHWNSLSNWVVSANNIMTFKIRLDKHWQHQEIIYDFRAQVDGTGSCSEVSRVKVV